MGRGGRKGTTTASPESVRQRVAEARAKGSDPEESMRFARSVVDGLGKGLDPGSLRPIAALHFLGIQTTASCDGHDGGGSYAFPWIDIQSESEGQWLLEHLPRWTIVQRGRGENRSWRLNPREIAAINNHDFDDRPRAFWQEAREELEEFADLVLGKE